MAEWAFQIARNVSGDREPDELTLDRLLAADPDGWDSTFVVAVAPRVPTEGGRMPKGVPMSQEEIQILEVAVKRAGSVNAFARDHVPGDDRAPTAIGQQVRQMLKGKRALEPGRTRIMNAATGLTYPTERSAPEVIDVEGEPYVKAEPGSVHPALDEHVYEPKADLENGPHADDVPNGQLKPGEPHVKLAVDDSCTLVDDLVDALRAVLLTEDSDQQGKYAAELSAAKLLLRLDR